MMHRSRATVTRGVGNCRRRALVTLLIVPSRPVCDVMYHQTSITTDHTGHYQCANCSMAEQMTFLQCCSKPVRLVQEGEGEESAWCRTMVVGSLPVCHLCYCILQRPTPSLIVPPSPHLLPSFVSQTSIPVPCWASFLLQPLSHAP